MPSIEYFTFIGLKKTILYKKLENCLTERRLRESSIKLTFFQFSGENTIYRVDTSSIKTYLTTDKTFLLRRFLIIFLK